MKLDSMIKNDFMSGNIASFKEINFAIYCEVQPLEILVSFDRLSQDSFLVDICETIFTHCTQECVWVQKGESDV